MAIRAPDGANNKVKNDCSYKQTSSSLGFAPKTSKARLTWNRIDLAQKVIFSQRLFKFLVLLRHTLLQSSKAVMISLSLVSGVKKSFVCSILIWSWYSIIPTRENEFLFKQVVSWIKYSIIFSVGHWTFIVRLGQLYQHVEVFIRTLVAETCLISPELLGPEGKPLKDGRPKISL